MVNLKTSTIKTAGAYVHLNDLYIFALGIHPYQGCTPVFRLGGHIKKDETGWQCAVREASEEADIEIKFMPPIATYLADGDHTAPQIQKIAWADNGNDENIPFLVVQYFREGQSSLSLMYLAETDELPKPSSEVKGLLLLRRKEIHRICEEQISLQQYLEEGGQAILDDNYDKNLLLCPFLQLRLLSQILTHLPTHSDITPKE